ncbi:MAG: hypothetical protein M2R45_03617 [Verrucomicrobia subdivision 3 bacterium]|nr:hypothetical protein [Limisphaerales bacterium]MCS1416888.1 hypothetical protein [Limisphaerales bacterium]
MVYPQSRRERNRWIISRRGSRHSLSEDVPYAFLKERELSKDRTLTGVFTVFLTNRECPWKCFMCDLWKNTLESSVAPGVIPRQIKYAFERLGVSGDRSRSQVKLYNNGSFFDPRAIPVDDYAEIARLVSGFRRVIVECHPLFIGDLCQQFRDLLTGELEVAIGLETAHTEALEKLNKGFGVDDFRQRCDWLREREISIRVFLLMNVPFIPVTDQAEWVERSIGLASEAGAAVICLIPTRFGNGALETLVESGDYRNTQLDQLEDAMDSGLRLSQALVLADLWDLEQFSTCQFCFPKRRFRLEEMNRQQAVLERIECSQCHGN